ncbi:acyl-CoA dehydrogenase family protein [Nocardioides daeguensis]|uniref:Dibenzothiophene monooxygenase n=1 Tax=Nocardioides daeguensis TaxID=908359 RepID=A0ABP6UXC9_9ACTN|nr:acyl-CoA dehydrogenase family protein [Nocardioides daeguensis]MBV6725795.1 acyl-CoA dehydrogenase family protein [Nocardioides daeguensis]MCR1772690.1 acyl-CoA dehydrogenase family protein [Nocardioides daeguensis]
MSVHGPAHDSPTYRRLRDRFAPVLESIAQGALQRELDRELPHEQVRALKEAGFGAVRVPVEAGGSGASVVDLTALWIDLAAADNNLAQALRGHAALVEDRLWQHARGDGQARWFARFVAGEIAGNAWSEVGSTSIDSQRTVLTPVEDRSAGDWVVDGTKYYSTGSIFAEWADVYARRVLPEGGEDFAIALVDLRSPGVSVVDDWDGFGQRGTGSGTATFAGVLVPGEDVLPFGERFVYQTALYQLNLLATLAGIGRAALTDVVEQVRRRTRNFSHANAERVRDDPQVLARVGEIAARVYAAEAATLRVAAAVQRVADAQGSAEENALNEAAEVESAAAQVVVSDLILSAASDLFDTLGASSTSTALALDRHWRNARTVASHNPRILKQRVVGAHLVNGTPPPYAWAIGRTERGADPVADPVSSPA